MKDNELVNAWVEGVEEDEDIPFGHRIAKAALATVAAVIASWSIQNAYNRYLLNRDDADEPELSDNTSD